MQKSRDFMKIEGVVTAMISECPFNNVILPNKNNLYMICVMCNMEDQMLYQASMTKVGKKSFLGKENGTAHFNV